jgi:uncharacterized membrane protein SirB2
MLLPSVDRLIDWISSTHANAVIRDTAWIIPAVQVVHILAIAVVMGSVLLLNLRVIGIISAGETNDAFTRRYLPWVWSGLAVLLISGAILIIGEPGRDLKNATFWTKMALIVCAIALTLTLERPVLHDAGFWDRPGRRLVARVMALLSMGCWVGITLCGRWIAYTYGT